MIFEAGTFRVTFSSNDRFVQLMRVDPSKQGGVVAAGDFVKDGGDIEFVPKRNERFNLIELGNIIEIVEELSSKLK